MNIQNTLYALDVFLSSDVYSRLSSVIVGLDDKAEKLYYRWGDYLYFVFDYLDYSFNYNSFSDSSDDLRDKVIDLVDTFDIFFEHKQCRRTLVLCHEFYLLNILNPFFYAYLDYVSKDIFMRASQVYEFLNIRDWIEFKDLLEKKVLGQKHKEKYFSDLNNYVSTSDFKEYLYFFSSPRTVADYLIFKNRRFNFLYCKIDSIIGLSLLKSEKDYIYFDYISDNEKGEQFSKEFICSIKELD